MKLGRIYFEGFYRPYSEHVSHLPFPAPAQEAWKTLDFLEKLERLERQAQSFTHGRNLSCCMCSRTHAPDTYHFKHDGIIYVWPAGLRHYIRKHNVRPTEEFMRMVSTAVGEDTEPYSRISRKEYSRNITRPLALVFQ